jgi:hypothetical protein
MTKQEFISTYSAALPPFIARQEVRWFLGGIIAVNTLAKADSDGRGPKGAVRVSGRVVYPTADLLSWLCDRGYADIGESSEMIEQIKRLSLDRSMSPRILPADLPRHGAPEGQDARI